MTQNEELVNRLLESEKQQKILHEDKEKLKQRIAKMAKRGGRIDNQSKTCGKCGKEFNEKENFNWSCRTHQSSWGGEMWWCCGKRGKDMPGCKFGKHEFKEEEEDEKTKEEEESLRGQ